MAATWISWLLCIGLSASVASAPPSAPAVQLQSPRPDPAVELAGHLRRFILEALPDPLFADTKNWGKQARSPLGKMKNDGRWHKLTFIADNPAATLQVQVLDMQRQGNRTAFTVRVRMPAKIVLDRQTWKFGQRLYSGSTRARVRIEVVLTCEVLSRTEKREAAWLPDMILRWRITQSQFRYYDLVVEHTAGIGGDGARLLGEALIGIVKMVKPNLDRDLTAKVNAAILKAGDTKEVRISLTDWLSNRVGLPHK